MSYPLPALDSCFDRRATHSLKWDVCGPDELPLWVADMDFPTPEPVLEALRQRIDHGILGYTTVSDDLREAIVARLERLYAWQVSAESLVFLPGVVPGVHLAIRAVTREGDGVLFQTPVYPPIHRAPKIADRRPQSMELTRSADGTYGVDMARMASVITAETRLFLFCNPHNPVGRVFRRDELAAMAEFCLRNDVTLCADEIHCDLVFPGHPHIPIASLDPEIARHTITLMSPSKTFNIAGLQAAFAVIPDRELRRRFKAACDGWFEAPNLFGCAAALAAYRQGQPWLEEVLAYLRRQRDFVRCEVERRLPGVRMIRPEGTFLAWLDCRELALPENAGEFFRRAAGVVLNEGATFGPGGAGFARLNFATCHARLVEAMDRMAAAVEGL